MFVLSCGLLEVENKVILMKWLLQPFLVTEKRASFYVQILVTVPIDTQKQNEGVCCLMNWKGKLGAYSLPNISFNRTAEYTLVQVSVGWWDTTVGLFLTAFKMSPVSALHALFFCILSFLRHVHCYCEFMALHTML